MFFKASSFLPTVNPLPHRQPSGTSVEVLQAEGDGGIWQVQGGIPWKADPPFADGASQQEKIRILLPKGQK